jgi:hypothetical protein
MKTILLAILFLFSAISLNAQEANQGNSSPYVQSVFSQLNVNAVNARIWNNGSMFWDFIGSPYYEVPSGSGKHAIFSNGFWIGGLDAQNQLHIAAQTYRQSGDDFWPGPLDTINATITSMTSSMYDSIWEMTRSTIDDFIWHYNNGDVQSGSYTIPRNIANWPANTSGTISRTQAPYYDANNDGFYNPMDGDCPDIRGSQMLWAVFNDNFSHHTETQGRPLGVEVHQSAYAYSCSNSTGSDTVLNFTTFYHYDIFNRSDTSYHNVYLGLMTDVDLGNYLDDYVGCDSVNNYAFAYNGLNNDVGASGYGLNPPMINQLILKGPVADANDGIDNDHNGTTDEPGETFGMSNFVYYNNDLTSIGNPVTADDHYNYMQSSWKDSTRMTYGGTGYNPGSTAYTNYMFTGVPYSGNGWTELTPLIGSGPNQPDDRRFITTSGPFSFPAHGNCSLDIAYVFTRDPNNPNGLNTSINVNQQAVATIRQMFNSNTFPCDNILSVSHDHQPAFSIFPNPANEFLTISFSVSGTKEITVKNLIGQAVTPTAFSNELSYRIDLSSFSKGIYFVTVTMNKTSVTKKVVIN